MGKKEEEKNKQVKAKHNSIKCKLPKIGMTHTVLVKKSYLLASNIIAVLAIASYII